MSNDVKNSRKIMIFGTFDLLHLGHISLIKQARKYGDNLILVLARDETVKKLKGFYPTQNIDQRAQKIADIKLVNKIVKGKLRNYYQVINNYQPDVICLGYDQTYLTDQLKDKIQQFNLKTKVVRLKSFESEKYKSSIIKGVKPH